MTPKKTTEVREYAILGYYSVLGMLAERTASGLAADICLALTPSSDESAVRKIRTETDDAVSVCLRKGTPPFSDLQDLRDVLSYAEKGGALMPRQLLSIAGALGSAKRVRAFLTSDIAEGAPAVRRPAEALVALPGLERSILDAIVSDTELADGASPALRRLRRAIEQQNEKIRAGLAKFITGRAFDGVLMDKVITMRNGRFVVPVKQEQQSRFPGIVHDRSKGGATIFVEPQVIVDMNNKLKELELEEQAEVERILAELSADVGTSAQLIRENQELLTRLDFFFAKAKLSLDMKACPAERSVNGIVDIEGGRNPLIDKDEVVPINLGFGGDERILIITGPNTGGKTVTLKTAGLFILMAQAGLHVPASRAALPVVSRVFADIGDEQSIEQSLSTFSSHMKKIVDIVRSASADSIVLLDELGAGTDPTEGAALAIAILETLRSCGPLVMATTHYTELKKYAIATESVCNASMEFDLATLSPTYRLNMGNPGRSNAFEIASRLGLDKKIVAYARELPDAETLYFDDVMEQIERDRKDADAYLTDARTAGEEAEKTADAARRFLAKMEREQGALLAKAKEKADGIVEEAVKEADAVRDELKKLIRDARTRGVADGAVDAGDALRRVDEGKKRLKTQGLAQSDAAQGDGSAAQGDGSSAQGDGPPVQGAATQGDGPLVTGAATQGDGPLVSNGTSGPSPCVAEWEPVAGFALAPGDIVALPGSDATGEVLTAPDEKGRVVVRAGSVKLTLASGELEKRKAPAKKPGQGKGRYAKIVMSKMDHIKPSIDIHGKNLDEAEMLVEKYLDDAMLARMHEVIINHGRGSGILRDGIRKMLKKNRHVAKYRNGDFDEGGDGVTVVTLSDK